MKGSSVTLKRAPAAISMFPEQLIQQTADYFRKGIEGAANTRIAYTSDIEQLRHWLQQQGISDLPISPATWATYLSD